MTSTLRRSSFVSNQVVCSTHPPGERVVRYCWIQWCPFLSVLSNCLIFCRWNGTRDHLQHWILARGQWRRSAVFYCVERFTTFCIRAATMSGQFIASELNVIQNDRPATEDVQNPSRRAKVRFINTADSIPYDEVWHLCASVIWIIGKVDGQA